MPYFIYCVEQQPGQLVKKLSCHSKADSYKQAKSTVSELRKSGNSDPEQIWKIIFADSELHAEELLQEKRDEPVLMEWEK